MIRGAGLALAALVLGCGSLPTTEEGVAFLEIQPPVLLTVEVGDSLQFIARALDKAGTPLSVEIQWRTPDTTISIGPTGVVTGLFAGSGRVQALVASEAANTKNPLISDFFTVTVTEPPVATTRRP